MNFSKNPNPFLKNADIEKVEKRFYDMEFGTFGFDKLELTKIKKFSVHTVNVQYKPIATIKFKTDY